MHIGGSESSPGARKAHARRALGARQGAHARLLLKTPGCRSLHPNSRTALENTGANRGLWQKIGRRKQDAKQRVGEMPGRAFEGSHYVASHTAQIAIGTDSRPKHWNRDPRAWMFAHDKLLAIFFC